MARTARKLYDAAGLAGSMFAGQREQAAAFVGDVTKGKRKIVEAWILVDAVARLTE
jgi:hypothetical protein